MSFSHMLSAINNWNSSRGRCRASAAAAPPAPRGPRPDEGGAGAPPVGRAPRRVPAGPGKGPLEEGRRGECDSGSVGYQCIHTLWRWL